MSAERGSEAGPSRDPAGGTSAEPGPGDPGVRPGGGPGEPLADERGPIGPFPSWPWVYGTVLVYGVVMILVLWVVSRILDPGLAP